jgi:hypothetical protein
VIDHAAATHDWECCAECVAQAVDDEILAPGSRPLPVDLAIRTEGDEE